MSIYHKLFTQKAVVVIALYLKANTQLKGKDIPQGPIHFMVH